MKVPTKVLGKLALATFVYDKASTIKTWGEIALNASDEATRNDAYFKIAEEAAKLVGIGIPTYYLEKALEKTGLDRVFDSLKDNQTFKDYMQRQGFNTELLKFSLAKAMEYGIDKGSEWLSKNGTLDPIFDAVNQKFSSSLNFVPRRDPLVLDLDGDGVETIGLDSGVKFDFDGDGIKTGTGWVKGDDGLLVLDRDANGLIDSGAELFGVDTVKSDGTKATNGFDALEDLDSNDDNIFDANDDEFANVRVWQDLNGDGISQATELKTLSELHIKSIALSSKTSNQDQSGNIISAIGSFTYEDGHVSELNGNQSLAANLDLAANPFYSDFPVGEISKDAAVLPGMKGAGAVRNLAEAASGSNVLMHLLENYSALDNRAQQLLMLGDIVTAWAGTSTFHDFKSRIGDLVAAGKSLKFEYSWNISSDGNVVSPGSVVPTANELAQMRFLEELAVLEAFNGQGFFDFSCTTGPDGKITLNIESGKIKTSIALGSITNNSGVIYITEKDLVINPSQASLLDESYALLLDSLYDGVLLQTRLKPYVDDIELTDDLGYLDFGKMFDRFDQKFSSSKVDTLIDLIEMAGTSVGRMIPNEISTLIVGYFELITSDERLLISSQLPGFFVGNEQDNTIQILTQKGYLFGLEGDDRLFGGERNDVLVGAGGIDYLSGGGGNDLLVGGFGNDTLYGELGDDYLDGDEGADYLSGGEGSDTYRFSRGWGQDQINNYDSSKGKLDAIEFESDIAPEDIIAGRTGDDLTLSLRGTNDTITVQGYFINDGVNDYRLEVINFSNGVQWTIKEVKLFVLQASAANDYIVGYASDDLLSGLGGNDSINGRAGNDVLNGGDGQDSLYGDAGNDYIVGGAGNDTLFGGEGNDILDGGINNDILEGGMGSDVYVYGKGYGQDLINNFTYDEEGINKHDAIQLKGLTAADVRVWRDKDDLVVQIILTGESLRVNSHFLNGDSRFEVDEIVFSDGVIWDAAKIKSAVLTGANNNDLLVGYAGADSLSGLDGNDSLSGLGGADTLYGGSGKDILYGDEGNDALLGEAGNDVLSGGSGDDLLDGSDGNDILQGGLGSDTYIFGKGYGQDVINNEVFGDVTPNKNDVILLKGLSRTDITLRRDNNDLFIEINETGEVLKVQGHFYSDGRSLGYAVDQIQFGDGTFWNSADIALQVNKGTEGDDYLVGGTGADTLSGLGGDDILSGGEGNDVLDGGDDRDVIYGEAGNDSLLGGSGNDTLSGGDGNDILDGGTGNDNLSGGYGSDTYVFGKGYGQDVIDNGAFDDKTLGKLDVIQLKNLSVAEVEFRRIADDLVIRIIATGDTLKINSYYYNNGITPYGYPIDKIQFGDGTVWSGLQINAALLVGTDEYDFLVGSDSDDTVSGHGGSDELNGLGGNDLLDGGDDNDQIWGGDGSDTLKGGNGNDTLLGEDGNDVLDGGDGADYLRGGYGSDVYVFGKGYGQDVIHNEAYMDASLNKKDTIFLKDLNLADVSILRDFNDLVIRVKATGDSIRVDSHFYEDGGINGFGIDQIQFGDGTFWSSVQIKTAVIGGTENDDALFGYVGGDTLNGLGGNDTLRGGDGDDVLDGGDGKDQLYGENGNDLLLGGRGDDVLRGGDGNDVLDGGVGDDTLSGQFGSDTYIFGKGYGHDTISNAEFGDATPNKNDLVKLKDLNATDVRILRDGSDLLIQVIATGDSLTVTSHFYDDGSIPRNYFGINHLQFSDGSIWDFNDILTNLYSPVAQLPVNLSGTESANVLTGNTGDDTLHGNGGNDVLSGSAGNDKLYGDSGDDTLDGGVGNDTMDGGNGNDTYLFGKGGGQDIIDSVSETRANKVDTVKLSSLNASDIMIRRQGNDLIIYVIGTSDTLKIINHFITDGAAGYQIDRILFADGSTWNQTTIKAKVLVSTDGDDSLWGYASNDSIDGGSGDDVIFGGSGNDTLLGSGGADSLVGDAGDDSLNGGIGNDVLDGGSGNDTYLFGKGAGQDVISAYENRTNKVDTIKLIDLNVTDVSVKRIGDDLVIYVNGTTDAIKVSNHFASNAAGGFQIDRILFANGSSWTQANIKSQVLIGTTADDILQGFSSNDTINGGAGNDILIGGAGTDNLSGGNGDDSLSGNEGDDILDGGAGNDTFDGGDGNDSILFGRGSGQDSVINSYDARADKVDTVKLVGLNASEVTLRRDGTTLIIIVNGTTDTLKVMNHFSGDATWSFQIDRILFADGSSWNQSNIMAQVLIGDATDNVLWGTERNDTLDGGAGDDILNGDWGDDVLLGGAGVDVLNGEIGADTLIGGTGDDILNGGSENDVLDGGTGNDLLDGQDGDDIYLFSRGAGQDVITNSDENRTGKVDTIQLNGLNVSDVRFSRNGSDLIIHINGTNDSLRVINQFADIDFMLPPVDRILFADGSSWDKSSIKEHVLIGSGSDDILQGYSGDDRIDGGAGDDSIQGGLGNDIIIGGGDNDNLGGGDGNDILSGNSGDDGISGDGGDDVLDGGAGNDFLNGGAGNDVYLFGRNSDRDVINNYHIGSNADVIRFDEDISFKDLWFRRDGTNLEIDVVGTANKLVVSDWYSADSFHISTFTAGGGKTLVESQVQNLVNSMASFGVEAGGETNLTVDQRSQLDVVLAASWK